MSSTATELVDAVGDELGREYRERNTPKKAHENEVAHWLAAKTSVNELLLFYRAQLRRGHVEPEQAHDLERHIERLQRTIGEQLEQVRK